MRFRLALVALLVAPVATRAAELSATTTTVVRAFDLRRDLPGLDPVRSYRPVDQLARVSWDDLGKRRAWTIDAQVRYRFDLATGRHGGRIDLLTGELLHGHDDDFDVLLAQASWRSPQRLLELRLGRQQAITGFGWHAFDGVRLDFPRLERLRVFTFAGLPIQLAGNGSPDTGGFTWASGVTGVFPRHGSIGVDYEIRRFDGSTSDETAGFDLGLAFGGTHLEASGDYSLLLDTFGETHAAVRHRFARRHEIEGRFTRVRPVFPLDDDAIWLVFDLNPADELRLSYEHRGARGLDVGAFVAREEYEDTGSPIGHVIRRAAVTARWETRREGIHRSELGWQDGWSGSRLAARHDSDWGVGPRLRVGAGASFQRYENVFDLTEEDEAWALRGRVRHDAGRWDVGLEVEQLFGRERDTLRGVLVAGTRWGAARQARKWWEPWWGGRFRDALPRGLGVRHADDAAAGAGAGDRTEAPEAAASDAAKARTP